jgi:dienelactone hydrolase
MSSDVSYEVEGKAFTGYLADGSGGKTVPGVLVLHEASGLGAHARQKADALAELGFVAFAADLFGGVATTLQEAGVFIGELASDTAKLRRRANAALDMLKAQPHVDAARTAAIGFCFGGQAAFELARSGADLRAVAGFHAGLKTTHPQDAARIKGKLLACLGDRDPLVTREARDAFMENMTENKVDCQMLLFSGVGHSFTNPDAQAFGVAGCHYDPTAERRSWAAMQQLFLEAFAP